MQDKNTVQYWVRKAEEGLGASPQLAWRDPRSGNRNSTTCE